jgi:signal transduction histidine kinase
MRDIMDNKSNPNQSASFLREVQIEYLIHELKNPVSIVETGLQLLLEKREHYGELSLKQEKTLNRSLKNAKKMREMLNDLLEIGRSEAGCFESCKFQPVQIIQMALEETVDALPEQDKDSSESSNNLLEQLQRFGIHLDVSSEVSDMELYQDAVKFRQIFGNLIKNALHHRKKQIIVRVQKKDDSLLVDVVDDGPGVKPEHHEMIFKRYAQPDTCSMLDRSGHGLGLAGSRILANCLGGDIKIIRKKGKGATFRLILPLSFECKT